MTRWLVLIVGSLIAFAFLRNIISMVMGELSGKREEPVRRAPSGPPSASEPQSLVKDPVCGTFVAVSSRWVKQKGGETYRFCSAECRDKFAA